MNKTIEFTFCPEAIDRDALAGHFLTSVRNDDGLMGLFLKLGADPNENRGEAINIAIGRGDLKSIKMLHKYGAKFNSNYLEDAIGKGRIDIVRFLLEKGVKITDDAWCMVGKSKNENIVRILLRYCTAVSLYAFWNAANVSLEAFKMVLKKNGGKLPKDMFGGIACPYVFQTDMLESVLKYILNEKNIGIMEEIMKDECVIYKKQVYVNVAYLALERSIMRAYLNKVMFLLDYLKDCEIQCEMIDVRKVITSNLVKNAKSSKELNEILTDLKQHGALTRFVLFDAMNASQMEGLYKKANGETFKILDMSMDPKFFRKVVNDSNTELLQDMLNAGLRPSREDYEWFIDQRVDDYMLDEKLQIAKILFSAY